jgi:RNA polymerase sigma-70 factor (ECF subfamily)
MVSARLDRRLTARLDPSDVVQGALADAARKLPDYLRERPLPFYPWLRQLAGERLAKFHERHLRTDKRSVTHEQAGGVRLTDESALELAERLIDSGSSPSQRAMRSEQSARVRAVLQAMDSDDCEVLTLRYLEQLSTRETAAALGITEGAVKTRHLRALRRLRLALVAKASAEEVP